ncbi:hypothetical protein DUNSADRAFT_16242 [Dunaliella salina]|uniref:Beta-carotene isomerase D27-like C-terminal domain-containing protein n=1 Tax=Dunaliella salina TaxID=3046 RepID=A0ABQ7H154_DUNSA|nr:hypothetical protein DUNSADRAFT_16242 [Dunaliella salina]|eukprot:KAF5840579.1 hypothetical protein DUNSADRAFT_16242 [Dunaliella salina]
MALKSCFEFSHMSTIGSRDIIRFPVAHRQGHVRGSVTRGVRAAAQQPSNIISPTAKQDPFQDPTVYNDSAFDRLMITIFTKRLVDEMADEGQVVDIPRECSYEDLVRVSRDVMKGRTPEEQAAFVRRCMQTLAGGRDNFLGLYRRFLPPSKWTAELNAMVASLAFAWLVGESETQSAPIQLGERESSQLRKKNTGGVPENSIISGEQEQPFQQEAVVRDQRSVVKIKKCRYLEASGCVAICNNLCKTATQDFFQNDWGMPLHMKPNFEDLSCEMIFGQEPPSHEDDEAFKQPCFVHHCSALETKMAQEPKPCRKL